MKLSTLALALALAVPATAQAQFLGAPAGGYGYGAGYGNGGYGGYGNNGYGGYGNGGAYGAGYGGYGNGGYGGYGGGYGGNGYGGYGNNSNNGLPYGAYGSTNITGSTAGLPYGAYGNGSVTARPGEDVMSLGRARQDTSAPAVTLPGAAAAAAAAAPAAKRDPKGARIEGVAKVIDGNTLVVGSDVVILNGADAPENAQTCSTPQGLDWRCGQRARYHLSEMVEGKRIVCTGQSLSGNAVVAACRLGQTDIGKAMVADGLAYSPKAVAPAYIADESAAKADRRGVWSGTGAAPWDFRAKN